MHLYASLNPPVFGPQTHRSLVIYWGYNYDNSN